MKFLTKNKHWDIIKDYNLDKLLYLLIDRPDYINHWKDFVWENVIKKLTEIMIYQVTVQARVYAAGM